MNYHSYGTDPNQYSNPFKKEGYLYLIRGGIITLLGIISLFIASSQLKESQSKGLAGIQIFVALGLLGVGLQAIIIGWQRTFKFIIDRGLQDVPPNLPKQDSNDKGNAAQQLDNMLEGRKNLAFVSPKGLIPQTLERFFPQFMFLPYPLRNSAHRIVAATFYTFITFLLFTLSIISEKILTENSNATSWLGLVLIGWIILIWFKNRPNNSNFYDNYISDDEIKFSVIFIGIGFVFPVLLNVLGIKLPPPPVNPLIWILTLLLLGGLVLYSVIYLTKIRAEYTSTKTEISEFTGKNWQYNLHPTDLFRFFENAMMQQRFLNRPNRIYRVLKPILDQEGSINKGNFKGDTIMETQPALGSNTFLPTNFIQIQWYSAILGQALCVISSLVIVFTMYSHNTLDLAVLEPVVLSFLFWLFGTSLITIAHKFWAEVQFTSYLVHFSVEGSYNETRLKVGKGFQDSVERETISVQSNMTPTLRTTKITSVGFASPTAPFLMVNRYVLDMELADEFQQELLLSIQQSATAQKEIVSLTPSSIENIDQIGAINTSSKQQLYFPNTTNANNLISIPAIIGIENKRWKVKNIQFEVSYLFLKGDENSPYILEMMQNGYTKKGTWEPKANNLIEIKIEDKTYLYEVTNLTNSNFNLQTPNTPIFMELEIE